ncbi:DUF4367 domain-containing protein [Neobacillus novalis]|uniref:DUF4367 domain-containing protein n=1 Tax=Neobacillus novalis TaxID=220687 RepID=A0AA95SDB3_9BACI|nr:DUF4367 domain-containing protein [Neobacillus novalis]WHY88827.1 DUF4367 domain-containing protein [Neobacillus novalis]
MTDPKKDIKKVFSEELDQTLFESLDFQSRLQDEVRKKLTADYQKESGPTWLAFFRKRRVYSTMLVAAAVCLVFFSSWLLRGDNLNQAQPKTTSDNPTLFRSGGNDSNDPLVRQSWVLDSENEVRQAFGTDVLLPTYTPGQFKLDGIYGYGSSKEQTNKLVFTYSHEDQSYLVIIERNKFDGIPHGFEDVDINGTKGYLNPEDGNTDTELHWYLNDVHYWIAGHVSTEEAVKIAKSFK